MIRAARAHNCVVFSGVQTATEAFTAVDCGVTAFEIFPGRTYSAIRGEGNQISITS